MADELALEAASRTLCAFFSEKLDDLRWSYDWFVPETIEIQSQGSPYRDNVHLKEHYHQLWCAASTNGRIELAKSIVGLWGGIRANKAETIQKFVELCSQDAPETPFTGVASYSKILAIADPKRYAIYDARVAVALNAIQYLNKCKAGIFFNYVPGRNRITGNVTKRTGFAFNERFSKQSFQRRGWSPIAKDATYQVYLDVLHWTLPQFPTYRLYDLEMSLFCNAERLALQAMYDDRSWW